MKNKRFSYRVAIPQLLSPEELNSGMHLSIRVTSRSAVDLTVLGNSVTTEFSRGHGVR